VVAVGEEKCANRRDPSVRDGRARGLGPNRAVKSESSRCGEVEGLWLLYRKAIAGCAREMVTR
jgi:hypothetical protein